MYLGVSHELLLPFRHGLDGDILLVLDGGCVLGCWNVSLDVIVLGP
jgi:hypothetical protein